MIINGKQKEEEVLSMGLVSGDQPSFNASNSYMRQNHSDSISVISDSGSEQTLADPDGFTKQELQDSLLRKAENTSTEDSSSIKSDGGSIRNPTEDAKPYSAREPQARNGDLLKALEVAPLPLDLPTDRPRLTHRSLEVAKWSIRLEPRITQLLKNLTHQRDIDLNVGLLAAWAVVLSRLTGQENFAIGLRSGLFTTPDRDTAASSTYYVIIHVDLSGDPDIIQLLERIKRATMTTEAYGHDDSTPLKVAFNWSKHDQDSSAIGWTQTSSNAIPAGFELDLHMQDLGDQIVGVLHYAAALFDSATIERHAGYLHSILEGMASDITQSVAKIDILPPAERILVLHKWNMTQVDYPDHLCLHYLFEQQVARTPKAIAVVHEDQSLTYSELNARANRLAHHLIKLGVHPDMPVAISVERSLEMIIGILAILKAGGAYVPLDPFYKSDRLRDILNDTAPTILVADKTGRVAIGDEILSSLAVVDPSALQQEDTSNPQLVQLTSRHVAYIIYTSGSTGKPKGVMVEHQGAVNLVYSRPKMFGIYPGSRYLQFASFNFSHSVSEIFSTLTAGASLYLLRNDIRQDRYRLWEFLKTHSITHVSFTSSLLQDCKDMPPLKSLRAIITVGETLAPNLPHALRTVAPNSTIINNYGSSEITSGVVWKCPKDFSGNVVPIGRPIPNKRIYLLDTHGNPVPLGVVGEIYVGGVGLARGYLNKPELTAERFLPDPFVGDAEARMYKTGDLARYLPDGNLVYIGRNDHQVKIRGFRIELGEIEAHLHEHPLVAEAVVVALGEGSNKRLVAYVIVKSDDQAVESTNRDRTQLSVSELQLDPVDGPIIQQLKHKFQHRQHRIDLAQAPLIRIVTAQESNGRWILVRLQHHLISDRSTSETLNAEIQAFLEGHGNTLPPPLPYRNLIAQARLGANPIEQERFFKEMLADIESPTLPYGLTNVHGDGAEVTEARRMLPQELNKLLRSQAKRLGVSLASLCHLAWALVIARTSGQQRVVFGTVLFGRMQVGASSNRAMGLFINTLPIRVDLDERSVEDGVRATHTLLAALLEHEHAPLALAQRCSGVPAGTPLFSSLLNYMHNSMSSDGTPVLSGMEYLGIQDRTNYPLCLSVDDFGNELGLTVQTLQQIEPDRVCGYMQQALESLANALEHTPNASVADLEVLPTEERTLLLQTWNKTQEDYPTGLYLHHLFEQQVSRKPDAIAVVYKDQTLTYSELNARANSLAHHLVKLGVQPDTLVGICVERTPGLIIGILAILKAGGAYVPLDPAHASERLVDIVLDASPSIVMADSCGRAALHGAGLAKLNMVDPSAVFESSTTNPHIPSLSPHHLAYIIYTSGSTGKPKGVMVEHRQVNRLFTATGGWYDFTEHDTWCLLHSFAFDFSVWEIWGALRFGGRLVIISQDIARSPQELYQIICKQSITVLNITPSAFKTITEVHSRDGLRDSLRYVIFGGEALAPAALQAWFLTHAEDKPQVVNMYGITETTVHVTYRRITLEDCSLSSSPIGLRIPDLRTYVLDDHGRPTPIGVVGELYVGGAGVARGYLNRPELTAERFLPDPFAGISEARMYKTGDLARYLPDGNLVYLGRNDHQVKIRGFRIELGEIEARLVEHPQVAEAVVVAIGVEESKRLVAYVIATSDSQLAKVANFILVQATRLNLHSYFALISWRGYQSTWCRDYEVARFDLELMLYESEGGIVGSLRYATSLFDRSTIERHVGYLTTMLRAMTADVDQLISATDLLSPTERTLLLHTWNTTQEDYPADLCLHHLFEQQVARTPDAIAVVHEDQSLTYSELNACANRLAHHLIKLGVQPDAPVGICVERSLGLIIGILAILKSGGAYVPLDPVHASERLLTILTDASPSIVLADTYGKSVLGETALSSRTAVDPNLHLEGSIVNPHVPSLRTNHLAYIIYTSGSTGKPKGVMLEHAQVTRLFSATENWFKFNELDTWCLIHSYGFDVSVWEMWGALRNGGKLVIVSQEVVRSPQELYRLVCEQGVSVLNLTPSTFKPIVDIQAEGGLCEQLRYVILAGEALVPAMLRPWYVSRVEDSPQIVNMYGPTETLHATYRPIKLDDFDQSNSIIGVRIPDLRTYVLDGKGLPLPLGAVGELYIGGASVARGYLNRPELTAERFLPDPFAGVAKARMYKTGDLVRYLPDGNLVYLGRNDYQVKIRGFRIELGEIEARLVEHPLVSEAVVVTVGDGASKRLVAYVVAKSDEQNEEYADEGRSHFALSLRSHLITKLPEYMVPSAFVRMDKFPLNHNGKLDRLALPTPVKFDLELMLYESEGGIAGSLRYATSLFDRSTIERHVGYLTALLRAMTADVDQLISATDLLTPTERTLLLQTWNMTQEDYPADLCLHHLFEQQVARTPDAIVVVHEDQSLTYSELNACANRLAHHLIKLGVQPDAPVGICVERSLGLIIGILAILKSGGAYVPLDPAYASERLLDILSDASPSVVLADTRGTAALQGADMSKLAIVDPNALPGGPTANPHIPSLSSHHLAYIIYTSGTTGRPKGVMLEHFGVVNLVKSRQVSLGLDSRSRLSQFFSFSFDSSVCEIFPTLCLGGSLHLLQDSTRFDRYQLWEYLEKHSITHVVLTPAVLQECKDLPSLSTPTTLIIAGEAISATLVRRMHDMLPSCTIINEYGPTETTVAATSWKSTRDIRNNLVPIGRPLINKRIYILDTHGNPVPLGAMGELYIGGVGVARGYLNRPELTAERFLPDPFAGDTKARMYKTGDLARYLPDGNLPRL
ncbi:uncharacterized protein VTP21DRAFT_7462 [Calcarisporiella thermophila]|uniref:uncharacterized protein n=1 Tax=Calcarisporiella thermophila TaxID=911321 RepID=UPI00374369DA